MGIFQYCYCQHVHTVDNYLFDNCPDFALREIRVFAEAQADVLIHGHRIEKGRSLEQHAEFLAKHFPENPVLAGLCFVCVNRTAPGVVENYLPGRVEIGSLDDRWPEVADQAVSIFTGSGVKCQRAAVLDAALWRKLCWNVPFNGLAIAAGGITTDLILADASLARRARRLMEEIQAAAALCGHVIPDSFLQGQFGQRNQCCRNRNY